MLAPTIIYLCSDETITSGTGKPVPYKVRRKFCTNIAQPNVARNDTVSTIVMNRDTARLSIALA